ncbi:MAG: LacI family transcriptional regulator [Oscillospiraceae bacterium]|nr:LacI family transcriptional regulator [Oscillospiraceae bacterium]
MSERNTPNIYDIAERAGVSIATVSRVLSGSDKVRETTRKRVMAVIEETGYTPNPFARGLGLGSMKMVGILCTDVSDLYYAAAISALERLLRRSGFDMLLYCTGDSLTDKKRYMGFLLEKHVDAIILVGSAFKEQDDNTHIENAAANVPVIIINGLVECPGVYCVLCDEKQAMYDNVGYLYASGRRRMLYLYDALTFSGMQKLDGFKTAHCDLGMAPDEALIIRCKRDIPSVRALVADMICHGPAFDAVLAAEDILSIGVCKALAEAGVDVPVIGFNNSILAQCATPELTSVDNRVAKLCAAAATMLEGLLEKRSDVPSKLILEAKLVRRSTF